MQKKRLFVIILLVVVGLIIAGCRVRSASEGEPQEPTQVRDQLASNTTPTTEVLDGDMSPTPTIPVLPTETFTPLPSPTIDGNVVVDESPTTEVVVIDVTESTDIPTDVPSLTPFVTETHTATAFPTDTLTFTPTFTASITPLPTDTPLPSETPLPTETLTFTPFPSLTPLPPTAIGQVGTEIAPQNMTATAVILTFAATQGTYYPTSTQEGVGVQTDVPAQFATATPTTQGFPDCDYLIDPGETLSQIARAYNMSTETLGNYNNLTNIDLIKAGDTLSIPGCGQNPTPVPTATTDPQILAPQYDNTAGEINYTVVEGNNIYKLSVCFGVTMNDILNLNGIATSEMNFISVGQVLRIPRRTLPVPTTTSVILENCPNQMPATTPTSPAPAGDSGAAFPTPTQTAVPIQLNQPAG